MQVKIVFVCHNIDSANYVLKYNIDFNIIFVGNKEINEDIKNDNRIIIARDYEYNIEEHNDLLTFTAWYLISKNNLFIEYEYICILEWDIDNLTDDFINNLQYIANQNKYDCISFFLDDMCFYNDINLDVFNYFLTKININPCYFNSRTKWFSTTNHCIKREYLNIFVDLYYPLVLKFKILDTKHISWYHERIFGIYTIYNNKNIYFLDGHLSHYQNCSHSLFIRKEKIPENLTNLYIQNDQCEFLNKFIEYYDIFNNIIQVCDHNIQENTDLYLFNGIDYTYSDQLYEKQKILYESAKKSNNLLQIGTYMSHSLLIILLANPLINITCIDTDNEFTNKTIKLLENKFNTSINFIKKNNYELPELNDKYDFIHFNLLLDNTNILEKIKETEKYLSTETNNINYIINNSEYYDNLNKIDKKFNNFYINNLKSTNGLNKLLLLNLSYINSDLKKIAYDYDTDKLQHGFINIYEEHFEKIKNDSFNLLEIGVFFGSSIKMWEKYFSKAIIYGADNFIGKQGNGNVFNNADEFWIEYNNSIDNYNNIELIILDQSNEKQLIHFKNNSQRKKLKFKIIIDDGSHLMYDQQITFFHLFDLVESNGFYIIEDIHSSEEDNYDLLNDKSNSTKKIFENIKNGDFFKSIYINNENKCNEISSQISDIKLFKIKEGSEVIFIYKK